MFGLTRTLIDWCDTKFEEALHEEDDRKATRKAILSGAVEGFMDAAILMYVPVVISCYVYKAKLKK
jgi:hypothetical protein